MTKQQIINAIARQNGFPQEVVRIIVNSFLESIKSSINKNEKIEIRGFGSFYRTKRKERKIYSPLFKESYNAPAKYVIAFKPSKATEKTIS